ncbi:MAG: hypothetical protein J3K34DRAFT_455400 [Monoraphidium minutum]|nr:MAG: hypothetical protein J3K34DRAFT_455400 [Monoraphidium minutum]
MAAEHDAGAARKRKWDEGADTAAAGAAPPAAAPRKAPLVVPSGFGAPSAPLAVGASGGPTLADIVLEKLRAEAKAAAAVAAATYGAAALPPASAAAGAAAAAEPGRDIPINDAPAKARITLTKRSVQEDIARRTRSVISTKGRYYPPGVDHGVEQPLYIAVRPAVNAGRTPAERQAACDAAAAEVQAILAGKPPGAAAAAGSRNPHHATVYIGFQAPPSFDLLNKIRGPAGSFLAHIGRTARVSVRLAGRGAGGRDEGPDPMHVSIDGSDPTKVAEAKALAQDLVATIRRDFEKAFPRGYVPPSGDAAAAAAAPGAAAAPAAQAAYGAVPPPASAAAPAPAPAPAAYAYPQHAYAPAAPPAQQQPYAGYPQQQPPPPQQQQQHQPRQQPPPPQHQQPYGYPPQQLPYGQPPHPYGAPQYAYPGAYAAPQPYPYAAAPGYYPGCPPQHPQHPHAQPHAPPGRPSGPAPYNAVPPPPALAAPAGGDAGDEPKRRRFVEGPPAHKPPGASAPAPGPGPQGAHPSNPYAQYAAPKPSVDAAGPAPAQPPPAGGLMAPPPPRAPPQTGFAVVNAAGGLPGLEAYGDD